MYEALLEAVQEKLNYIKTMTHSIDRTMAIRELKTLVDELEENY